MAALQAGFNLHASENELAPDIQPIHSPACTRAMNQENISLISGDTLKTAAGKYLEQLHIKANSANTQTLSIFDKWFLRVMTRLSRFDQNKPWEESIKEETIRAPAQQQALGWDFMRFRLFLCRWQQGRFVTYEQREKSGVDYHPKYGTEFGSDVLLTCQGAPSFMEWRGLPLMKTAFDFSIYPQLIAELRPQSIFEIGSGSGASAIWFADHMAMFNISGYVRSVDLVPVTAEYIAGVSFYQGDCAHPETLFCIEHPASALPHPWLVVEDAHHK